MASKLDGRHLPLGDKLANRKEIKVVKFSIRHIHLRFHAGQSAASGGADRMACVFPCSSLLYRPNVSPMRSKATLSCSGFRQMHMRRNACEALPNM